MKRRWFVLAACVALVAGPFASDVGAQLPPGLPVGAQALSLPGAAVAGYATPIVLAEKNLTVSYTNIDIVPHDFVHDVRADGFAGPKTRPWCKRFKKGKCPLFWSELAGIGQTVPVKGLSATKAGETYSFYCTIHPGMTGMLIFLP
jgi:hypothetical protein